RRPTSRGEAACPDRCQDADRDGALIVILGFGVGTAWGPSAAGWSGCGSEGSSGGGLSGQSPAPLGDRGLFALVVRAGVSVKWRRGGCTGCAIAPQGSVRRRPER